MSSVTNTDLSTKLDELEGLNTEKKFEPRGSSELGKDAFLKLLVTQLSNQDPLNPQSDQEFIAQLAQFSALEQMTNMSTTLTNTSAYGLVGKQVIVNSTDSLGKVTEVRGTVDAVKMKNGSAELLIDGKTYSIDDLVQVMDSYRHILPVTLLLSLHPYLYQNLWYRRPCLLNRLPLNRHSPLLLLPDLSQLY